MIFMYVLIVARGYPTERYKTNGIFEFDQAKALAKAGCKVIFAAIDVRSIRRWRKWGIERHNIEGVHVMAINIPCGRIPSGTLNKVSSIGLNMVYHRIVKEFGQPDVIHAHFTDLAYVTSKLKQRVSVPFVITEHSSLIMKPVIEEQLFSTAATAYRQAEAVIAVSPALVEIIEKNFSIQSRYVPNIVDLGTFSYGPRTLEKTFNFVSIGNLIDSKRMDQTIEAFHRSFINLPHVTLTIFGEGKERPELEKLIKKHHLESQVVLRGMCSRKVIAEKLKECDSFVLASRSETFGVAYIEALATGVPVIATKCGGPECFVHEGNGLLIPVDDVHALVIAMRYMYDNSRVFDREKISAEIRRDFSPERVAKKLIVVYESIT